MKDPARPVNLARFAPGTDVRKYEVKSGGGQSVDRLRGLHAQNVDGERGGPEHRRHHETVREAEYHGRQGLQPAETAEAKNLSQGPFFERRKRVQWPDHAPGSEGLQNDYQ